MKDFYRDASAFLATQIKKRGLFTILWIPAAAVLALGGLGLFFNKTAAGIAAACLTAIWIVLLCIWFWSKNNDLRLALANERARSAKLSRVFLGMAKTFTARDLDKYSITKWHATDTHCKWGLEGEAVVTLRANPNDQVTFIRYVKFADKSGMISEQTKQSVRAYAEAVNDDGGRGANLTTEVNWTSEALELYAILHEPLQPDATTTVRFCFEWPGFTCALAEDHNDEFDYVFRRPVQEARFVNIFKSDLGLEPSRVRTTSVGADFPKAVATEENRDTVVTLEWTTPLGPGSYKLHLSY